MFLGGAVVTLVFGGSVWAGENKATIKNFKRKNPTLFVVGVMITSYFLLSLCGGVMVFIFGITFPLLCKCLCIQWSNMLNNQLSRLSGMGPASCPPLSSLNLKSCSLNWSSSISCFAWFCLWVTLTGDFKEVKMGQNNSWIVLLNVSVHSDWWHENAEHC